MDKVKEFAIDKSCHNVNAEERGIDQLAKSADYFSSKDKWTDATQRNDKHASYLAFEKVEQAQEVRTGLDIRAPVDLIQIDFTRAWGSLGEITVDDTVQDELLTQLFSQFCLGK